MLDTYEKLKEFNYWRRNVDKPFMEITFLMTTECNFRCSYCYEHKYKSAEFNVNNAYSLIDKVLEPTKYSKFWNNYFKNQYNRNIVFNFFGGESLLEVDKMDLIIDYFLKRCGELGKQYLIDKFSFTFQSNGYLLQTEKVKKFLYKYQKYMTNEFISIDGCKEYHDKYRKTKDGKPTWDIVSENIKWFRKEFPDVILETKGTIVPEAVQYLYDNFLTHVELGRNVVNITDTVQYEWTDEQLEEAKKQFNKILHYLLKPENSNKRYGRWLAGSVVSNNDTRNTSMCHLRGCGITLYPDGKLYLCQMFAPIHLFPNNKNDYSIGDITNGISNKGNDFLEKMQSNVDKYMLEHKDKCQMCIARNHCHFCPAQNLKYHNDIEIDSKPSCKFNILEQAYGTIYRYMFKEKYGKDIE